MEKKESREIAPKKTLGKCERAIFEAFRNRKGKRKHQKYLDRIDTAYILYIFFSVY